MSIDNRNFIDSLWTLSVQLLVDMSIDVYRQNHRRVSLDWTKWHTLTSNKEFKISLHKMHQFLHMISLISPHKDQTLPHVFMHGEGVVFTFLSAPFVPLS